MKKQLLKVRNLHVDFKVDKGVVHAIRGVDFDLFPGETIAIVGESGSGKSVTSKAILGLLANNGKIINGSIVYEDEQTPSVDLATLSERDFVAKIRGKRIAMIFQDPMTSLDPTMTIGKQLSEGFILHQDMNKKEARQQSLELLKLVGIDDTEVRYSQYPHQFSGGMRQRIVIAIALSCNPQVLIADEPTTALDVTIQAQILELFKEIQRKTQVSIIFITHDLGVVAQVADYVSVMYAGKIVEKGTVDEIFYNPKHPYTWGLLSSMPSVSSRKATLRSIPGTPPNLLNKVVGDAFAPRNEYALAIDFEEEPPMFKVSETHFAATWLLDERAPKVPTPKEVLDRVSETMVAKEDA